MAYAISNAEHWQIVGFNKDNTQQLLVSARTLKHLLLRWSKEVIKRKATGAHNTLLSFKIIKVWNVQHGFSDLEAHYTAKEDYHA